MNNKSIFRNYTRAIAAGATEEINVYGRFLTLLEWDGALDPQISIGGQTAEDFPSGVAIELPAIDGLDEFFGKLRITNPNATTQSIRIATSAGRIFDNRLQLSGTVFDNILTELRGDSVPESYGLVNATVAAALIVPANANRRSALIQNLPTNSYVKYVGFDNTVSAAKFVAMITPGQIFSTDDYRGDLYLASATGAENVSYGEV